MAMRRLRRLIMRTPVLRDLAQKVRWFSLRPFPGSAAYWDHRYQRGGDSGGGSVGPFARFKAEVLNRFVAKHDVRSVIEFGCGDGNQLAWGEYPRYIGLDVAPKAVALCRRRFADDPTKTFYVCGPGGAEGLDGPLRADLALSLDVIYHLVEDDVFEAYMRQLFAAAERFVIVYSTDRDEDVPAPFIRHREFTAWVRAHCPDWTLIEAIPNRHADELDDRVTSAPDFFIYARTPDDDAS